MNITKEEFKQCFPRTPQRLIDKYYEPLLITLDIFQINTPKRISCFLAQVGHESLDLKYTEEIASGKAYEGRLDLGNTQPGDGVKFKGRGFIQLTGRANYKAFSDFMFIDFTASPELIETPELAWAVSGWFWMKRNLNKYADEGKFKIITKRINGGLNGYADRLKRLGECRKVFNING